MSTVGNWRGPNIIKDGLVLYLDAGSPNSYFPLNPTTTWKDISGNANNATLINGTAYNESNGGTFVFDGIDDYADCGNNPITKPTGSTTISYWFKGVSTSLNFVTGIGTMSFAGSRGYLLGPNTGTQVGFFLPIDNVNLIAVTYNLTIDTSLWYNICGVYSESNYVKLYLNGVEVSSTTTSVPSSLYIGNGISLKIGSRGDSIYFSGNISQFLMYHRPLSDSEVLQNFNSSRARFGI
jgi:hypothetical protein